MKPMTKIEADKGITARVALQGRAIVTNNETDRAIAEKVMGWKITRTKRGLLLDVDGDHGEWWLSDWTPSTNIAQAFGVVEELRERKLFAGFALKGFMDDAPDDGYQASFWFYGNAYMTGAFYYEAAAISPARAICLAALKAVE